MSEPTVQGNMGAADAGVGPLLMRGSGLVYLVVLFFLFGALTVPETSLGFEPRIGYILYVLFLLWLLLAGDGLDRRGARLRGGIRWLLGFLFVFLVTSLSGWLTLGSGSLGAHSLLSAMSILGFAYLAVVMGQGLSTEYLIRLYVQCAFVVASFALLQELVWIFFAFDVGEFVQYFGFIRPRAVGEGSLLRVTAWWQEPAHLGAFLGFPAVVTLSALLQHRERSWRAVIRCLMINLALVLTFSLSSILFYMPLLFGALLRRRTRQWAIGLAILIGGVFAFSENLRDRVAAVFWDEEGLYNMSVWALASNAVVSWGTFLRAPFGIGLGNHPIAYEQMLNTHSAFALAAEKGSEFLAMNSKDAASMYLRGLSELGIFSIAIWVALAKKLFALIKRVEEPAMNPKVLALACLFIWGIRQGSYIMFDFWALVSIAFFTRDAHSSAGGEAL